jgi:protein-S-isoprenylcysteine O-methyltransferase Ste14
MSDETIDAVDRASGGSDGDNMNQTGIHPRNSGMLRIYPPVLAGLLLLGALLLHLLGGHHHRLVHPHQLLGLLLIAGGVGLSSYAAALFSGHATTKNPYGQATTLVTEAPYTFTRNPMYLGLATILLGFAIFFGSPAMLIAPLIFFLMIDRMLIPEEEATLERLFGEHYLDYKRRVRRWL